MNWLRHPLVQISPIHCQSKTRRARGLKLGENVHPTQCVRCQVSRVMCDMSPVTCHLSQATCQKKNYLFYLKKIYIYIHILDKIGHSGGASQWRVCYQRGLPCLVILLLLKQSKAINLTGFLINPKLHTQKVSNICLRVVLMQFVFFCVLLVCSAVVLYVMG